MTGEARQERDLRARKESRFARWKSRSLRSLWWRRNLYQPGLGVCTCEICRATFEDVEQRLGVTGWRIGDPVAGCLYVNREKVFAAQWEKAHEFGDLFQELMTRPLRRGERAGIFMNTPIAFRLSTRERIIGATLIQWLGTNVGFEFLRRCLDKCGYRVIRKETNP